MCMRFMGLCAVACTAVVVWGLGAPSLAGDETGRSKEPPVPATAEAKSVHEFTVKDIDGKDVPLSRYRGEVCLIVNVASKCGLTDTQYRGLEATHRKYKDQGLRILAFPANNFGQQEPAPNPEIKEFCRTNYDVTFDLFAKLSVLGEDMAPLYRFLTKHPDPQIAGDVQWNFQKYLVDRAGNVIARFSPRVKPDAPEVTQRIETALKQPVPKEQEQKPKSDGGE